ncbi:MAG: sugar kinase [Thalassospira sp.]|uniref:sugar kinase n=1 Tax=Thalassospira sp. TaxID=1912094 RepID=UPI0032EFC987
MPQIAFIGECMLELSGALPGSVFGAAKLGFAGDTLNAATYMARTSRLLDQNAKDNAAYITALGVDAYSNAMMAAWQSDGIATDLVQQIDGALPGLYTIQTDHAGERSFSYWRDQAAAKQVLANGHDAKIKSAFDRFDGMYLSGISLAILSVNDRLKMIDLVGEYAKQGGKVYFDTNHRPLLWQDDQTAIAAYQAVAPLCDTILPTHDDDAALFGDISAEHTGRRWLDSGAKQVIVKSGGDPTYWCDHANNSGTITPPIISDIVDTTSAGDSFNGAFLAAKSQGKSTENAITTAQKVAGRVICRHGALVDISDLVLD